MDLGSVFARVAGKSKMAEKEEKFLAVKISSSEVLATVWALADGQVTIGHVGAEKVGGDKFEDLLHAADAAVSLALGDQNLPAGKTIFGVSPDWVDDGKIVEPKLEELRRLCKELDLRPLGYVQSFEAVENYLKEMEGAPLTAILIGLDGHNGWVTLYRAGKNLGTVELPGGESSDEGTAKRIELALSNFTQLEILPARIIIYDGRRDLKSLEEKIMAHPWTKQLQFLHFPRVESLAGDALVKAVAIAGGTQMGGKVEMEDMERPKVTVAPKTGEAVTPAETQDNREAEEEADEATGGKDETKPKEEVGEQELEEVSAEEAGFIQEGNLGQLREMDQPVFSQSKPLQNGPPKFNLAGVLKNVPFMAEKLTAVLGRFRLPGRSPTLPTAGFGGASGKKPPARLLIIAGVAAAVLVVLSAICYLFPQARVTVYLNTQSFDRQMDATISGQFLEVSEIGSKKGVATGKKMVGEKARGTVTIYGAAASKNFAAGTVLTSGDGLKFTLDQDVSVASASDFLSPATVTSKVTAADIGDKYNLPGNSRLSVGGQPTSAYLAKNDSAFSGGNSHEAMVVTKADQDRLQSTLSAELTQKAQGDLLAKLPSGQSLLPNAVTSEIAKKKFSKDADMEAETFSLDLTMSFKGITVSREDLVNRFLQKYSGDIPTGYQMVSDSAKLDIKSAKLDKNNNAVLSLALNGRLVPTISPADLEKEIAGHDPATATKIITANTGVDRVEIEAKPKIFQALIEKVLPWKAENIKIETVNQ